MVLLLLFLTYIALVLGYKSTLEKENFPNAYDKIIVIIPASGRCMKDIPGLTKVKNLCQKRKVAGVDRSYVTTVYKITDGTMVSKLRSNISSFWEGPCLTQHRRVVHIGLVILVSDNGLLPARRIVHWPTGNTCQWNLNVNAWDFMQEDQS